jgi:hypothetical protein
MKRAAVAATALLLCACAAAPKSDCPAGQQFAVNEFIYFGTETPGGVVSDDAWKEFLGKIVTPRFPQGFTTWDAAGQWRSNDGTLTREASHVLNLVHPADVASDSAIQAIIAEYKKQFRQEAVLRARADACISF